MTEDHFSSIRRMVCMQCAHEVNAIPSTWVKSLGPEGRAYLSDEEIAAQFMPAPHTFPGTTAWCVPPQR